MKCTIELTHEMKPASTAPAKATAVRKKIWIDLDNSPHVPFFSPIIPELKARGFDIFLTARNSYQVVELLEYYRIQARVIGRHHGKLKILKMLGTAWRALALAYIVRKEKPDISLAHGSRGCILASILLGIDSIAIIDYEHSSKLPFGKLWVVHPEIIPMENQADGRRKFLSYPGIKEDVIFPAFARILDANTPRDCSRRTAGHRAPARYRSSLSQSRSRGIADGNSGEILRHAGGARPAAAP